MKSIVLFDTNYGNTKTIAEAIANGLGKGVNAIAVADLEKKDLAGIGLLVVGSPINGWRPSERMLAFLSGLGAGQLNGIKAATFDTRVKLFIHGDAAQTSLAGKRPAGTSLSAPIGGST